MATCKDIWSEKSIQILGSSHFSHKYKDTLSVSKLKEKTYVSLWINMFSHIYDCVSSYLRNRSSVMLSMRPPNLLVYQQFDDMQYFFYLFIFLFFVFILFLSYNVDI
jgi:hypothetical protein